MPGGILYSVFGVSWISKEGEWGIGKLHGLNHLVVGESWVLLQLLGIQFHAIHDLQGQ